MLTVSLMLILIPFTGEFEDIILENYWVHLFPGLTFFVAGFIGGILTESEYKKAILMMAISYTVIGLFTVLSVSINCIGSQCFYINYTLLGIPIGIILTSLGGVIGYQIRKLKYNNSDDEVSQLSNEL